MTTSSITAALPGTASSTSRGQSCPSACAIGHIGPDQRDLVLIAIKKPAITVTHNSEVGGGAAVNAAICVVSPIQPTRFHGRIDISGVLRQRAKRVSSTSTKRRDLRP